MIYQIAANANDASPEHRLAQCVSIANWPSLKIRGMHIPLEGNIDVQFVKKLLFCLGMYHYNAVIFEVYDSVRYDNYPIASAPTALSKQEWRDLINYAKKQRLEVTPGINSLGHVQQWLFQPDRLNNETFRKQIYEIIEDSCSPEKRRERTLCPSNPKTRELLFGIYGELIDLFQPKYFFVGLDEAYDWCECKLCRGKRPAELLANHVIALNGYFEVRKIKMVMFEDMLLVHGEWPLGTPSNSFPDKYDTASAIDMIPRNIIIGNWNYFPTDDYPSFKYFLDKGFKSFALTWNAPMNIWGYAKYVKKVGGDGVYGTSWSGPGSSPGKWGLRTERNHLAAYVRSGDAFWSCDYRNMDNSSYIPEVEISRHYERHFRESGKEFEAIDLAKWCNWSLTDLLPGDGKREGFDYGPSHDLSGLTTRKKGVSGIPYASLNIAKAIALKGTWKPNTNAPSVVRDIMINDYAKSVLVLHTCGWMEKNGTLVANYIINYEDGGSENFEIICGRDILAFDSSLYLYDKLDITRIWPEYVGTTRDNSGVRVYALRLINKRPEIKIKSMQFESRGTCVAPLILAVTLEK